MSIYLQRKILIVFTIETIKNLSKTIDCLPYKNRNSQNFNFFYKVHEGNFYDIAFIYHKIF